MTKGKSGSQFDSVLLRATGLCVSFGGVRAVRALDVAIAAGQITALLGPNGAGKSTALNLISGFHQSSGGKILMRGPDDSFCDITGYSITRRAALGLARTFQTPLLFPHLDTLGNVMVSRCRGRELRGFGEVLMFPTCRRAGHERARRCINILNGLGLSNRARVGPQELSLGEQRLVEVARAIASDAQVLLLDEPFAGLANVEKARLVDVLQELAHTGPGILLVEHNVDIVRQLADDVVVMQDGEVLARGIAEQVLGRTEVIEAFLGTSGEGATSRGQI